MDSDILIYSFNANTWKAVNSPLQISRSVRSSFVSTGYFYLFGGYVQYPLATTARYEFNDILMTNVGVSVDLFSSSFSSLLPSCTVDGKSSLWCQNIVGSSELVPEQRYGYFAVQREDIFYLFAGHSIVSLSDFWYVNVTVVRENLELLSIALPYNQTPTSGPITSSSDIITVFRQKLIATLGSMTVLSLVFF